MYKAEISQFKYRREYKSEAREGGGFGWGRGEGWGEMQTTVIEQQ